jgi:hypothetical protein
MKNSQSCYTMHLMNPKEILEELSNRYATCATYSDRGCLFSWNESGAKTRKPQVIFRTDFEKSANIRFEWYDSDSKSVLLCNDVTCYSYRDSYRSGPDKQQDESAFMAIAGATGVSKRAAYFAPSLLLEEMRSNTKWTLLRDDINLLEDDAINNQECYCIQGSTLSSRDTTIWVSKKDFGLRRLRHYLDKRALLAPPKEKWTTSKLEPDEQFADDGSMLISLYKPPNSITRDEIKDFADLFQGTSEFVEPTIYGRGNSYTEITYNECEFEKGSSRNLFSELRRNET